MAQVCDQFSPFLFRVNNLHINTTQLSGGPGQNNLDGEQWLELVRSFGGAKDFCVDGKLVTDILRALGPADGEHITDETVLPALHNIRVQPMSIDVPLWDAAQPFLASRRLSDRPVELQFLCHICNTTFSFTEQQEFKTHLTDEHDYRIVCSYCSDFEWSGYNDLFPEHLESKHPEVAHNEESFDTYFGLFTPSQLGSLLSRHSFLCAPNEIPASPNDTTSSLAPSLSFEFPNDA
ncbi:hypothetical protein EDB92DRAFT_1842313 [Lactarius akahatsu]|uniref:Uncharacterized protein n=1 Tax=Lactarius akahatsu TaxID=416441 RepID=A0AAD4QGA7_9AGAM|nr:hypothetical protein EDB92DRAFT_1842313 [Lactarius akahatsu]